MSFVQDTIVDAGTYRFEVGISKGSSSGTKSGSIIGFRLTIKV